MDNYPLATRFPSKYDRAMKTFSDAFVEHLEKTGAKVTTIARAAGVTKDALYAVKRGTTQNMAVDDAIRVAAAFGETIEEFMGLNPLQIRDGLAEQLAQLTDAERAVIEATIRAFLENRPDMPRDDDRGGVPESGPADPKV